MNVSYNCFVVSGRVLYVRLIICPGDSYRVWSVTECDTEASIMRRLWPIGGCRTMDTKRICIVLYLTAEGPKSSFISRIAFCPLNFHPFSTYMDKRLDFTTLN